jgi:hypothetical protein
MLPQDTGHENGVLRETLIKSRKHVLAIEKMQ